MSSVSKIFKSSLVGISLLAATATPTLAIEPASATADILLARPIGLVGTVAGAGFWFATSPFTLINGTAEESYALLVQTPLDYTFKRPLGDGLRVAAQTDQGFGSKPITDSDQN